LSGGVASLEVRACKNGKCEAPRDKERDANAQIKKRFSVGRQKGENNREGNHCLWRANERKRKRGEWKRKRSQP